MVTGLDYFSYSQLKLWEASRKMFWERYVLDKEPYDSEYISKGRALMEQLEYGLSDDNDPLLEAIVEQLPIYDEIELKLVQNIVTDKDDRIFLKGYLDSAKTDLSKFYEYKTGKHPWSQEKVDEDTQLLFYSTMIFLKTKKIPEATLVWAQTRMDDYGTLHYTGNIFDFKVTFTQKQINAMVKRILKTIREIADWQFDELDIEEHLVKEYVELTKKRDSLTGRLVMLTNEIKTRLEEENRKYGTSSYGEFTLAEKTVFSYSDKIGEFNKEILNMRKLERESGTATSSKTTYLKFNDIKI